MLSKRIRAFTLLELLIVIAVLAILSTITVLILNPVELINQSRDSRRISDLEAINKALTLFSASGGSFTRSGDPAGAVYVSLPDDGPVATTSPNSCPDLNLPDISPRTYSCVSSANLRKTDSSGWVPVNFSNVPGGSPFSSLPIDPVNLATTGNYYTYSVGSWELTAKMESKKYGSGGAGDVVTRDGGPGNARYEVGTDLTLAPSVIVSGNGGVASAPPAAPGAAATIASIYPSIKNVGGSAFTLTVNGSNFISSSIVKLGGATRPTTFVSVSQVTAAISSSDLATTGIISVTVDNQGAASNSKQLQVLNSNNISWQNIGPGGGGWISQVVIDPTNENIIYAGTDTLGVAKSTDGGASWTLSNTGLKNPYVQKLKIDSQHANILYLGSKGGFYKSTNSGASWTKKINGLTDSGAKFSRPVNAIAIDPHNSDIIYVGYGNTLNNSKVSHVSDSAGYSQGKIFKTINGGDDWALVSTGTNQIQTPAYIFELAVDPSDANTLYATTEKGFYKSTNGGVDWVRKTTGIPYDDVRGLALDPTSSQVSSRVIYITVMSPDGPSGGNCSSPTWSGGVYKSTDGGETWVAKNAGLCHRNNGAEFLTSNYFTLTLDSQGIIYTGDWAYGPYSMQRSADGGATWTGLITTKNPDGSWPNIDIWSDSPGNDDSYGNVSIKSIAVSPSKPNQIYFSSDMTMFKSVDSGAHWTAMHTKETNPGVWQTRGFENTVLRGVAVDPAHPNNLFLGYYDIGLMRSTDNGSTFKTSRQAMIAAGAASYVPDIGGLAIDPSNSNIYVAGHDDNTFSNSVVMKSSDSGTTWSIIGQASNGFPLAGGVRSAMIIDPSSPVNSRAIYAAKYGQGVYKTTDGGQSWSAVNNGLPTNLNFDALAISPTDSQTLYLGSREVGQSNGVANYGGIFKTTSGGSSWTKIDGDKLANVYDLQVSPQDALTIYAAVKTHYDSLNNKTLTGGVYRSKDGGQNWSKILSDDKVRSMVINPQNTDIIYAATGDDPYYDDSIQAGLYKSIDGGDTWFLANNFPNTNSQYITLDPNDPTILYVGSNGSGVWRGIDR